MNRTRYLPPGSMRHQRRMGRLEGSVGTLLLVCAIGAGLVAATPAELYQPAAATVRPDPIGRAAPDVRVDLPPCTGTSKDCAEAEPDGAVTPLPRAGPQPAPLPQTQHQAYHVPEPGTLALIGAALAAALWRRS